MRRLLTAVARALAAVVTLGLPALFLSGCDRKTGQAWTQVDGRWHYEDRMFEAADPAGFTPIDGRFARDGRHGYYRGQRIEASNGASFEVLGDHEARDKRAVYYADTYRKGQEYYMVRHVRVFEIEGADPLRYRPLAHRYASDGQRVFKQGQPIRVRDAASFAALTPRLSRDAKRGYFEDIEIADSDGASFQIVDVHDDAWVRDRQRAWHVRYGQPAAGEPPQREVRLLAGADAAALRPLGREYASDGRRVWWRGQAVAGAEAASFTVLGEPAAASPAHVDADAAAEAPDARDARASFRRGRRVEGRS
ncbi:MAG: DKNYY domain-containing protein [Aquabacterium sp.]